MSAASPRRTGGARPVAPDRLSGFEQEDEQPAMSLPPRRPAAAGPQRRDAQPAQPETAPQAAPEPPARAQEPEVTPAGARVHASNAQIPVELVKPVTERCRERQITHGELIIAALEANAGRLGELVTPAPTVGGSLFPALAASARRTRTEEVTTVPLNFRLPPAHFAVLDQLVAQVGARSRSRLISAALAAYLQPAPAPTGQRHTDPSEERPR